MYHRHRSNGIQFLKFGIVGGSGVLVNLVVYAVLIKLAGGDQAGDRSMFPVPLTQFNVRYYHVASTIAFLIANLTNFQLNRTWTFKSGKHAKWWKEYGPFLMVGLLAQLFTLLILTALNHSGSPFYLPDPPFDGSEGLRSRKYWSQAIAVLLTMPINYIINKLWTFRAVRNKKPGDELPMVAPAVAPELVDEGGNPLPGVLTPEQRAETRRAYDSVDEIETKD